MGTTGIFYKHLDKNPGYFFISLILDPVPMKRIANLAIPSTPLDLKLITQVILDFTKIQSYLNQ